MQQSDELGYLVRVFDRVTSEPLTSIEELEGAGRLFPPVFVGLRTSVRSGRWQKIGTMPLNGFAFPKFRITMGTKPGTYLGWRIWDGKNTVSIGELPEHMRPLELKQVWGDEGSKRESLPEVIAATECFERSGVEHHDNLRGQTGRVARRRGLRVLAA